MHMFMYARFFNITCFEWRKQNEQAAAMHWVSSKGGVNATDRIAAMFKCTTAYWLTNIEIADLKFHEPISRSIQEPRADEAEDSFALAVLSLGGEGVGFLLRHTKAPTTLYMQHVLLPSSFKQNPLVQPEVFQKGNAY